MKVTVTALDGRRRRGYVPPTAGMNTPGVLCCALDSDSRREYTNERTGAMRCCTIALLPMLFVSSGILHCAERARLHGLLLKQKSF